MGQPLAWREVHFSGWGGRSLGPGEGGLKQKWLLARTVEEAKHLKSGTETRVKEGTFVAPSRQTLGEFLTEWLPAIESSIRAITFAGYRSHVKRHIVPALGQVLLQRLDTPMVNTFYSSLVASGLAPATVHRVHATLHRALRDARRWGRVSASAAEQASLPRARRPDMRTWTANQLRHFLDHVHEDRLYPAYLMLATTGMRRGECLALRWLDLDLVAGRVSVRRSLIPVGGTLRFEEPKSGRNRSVALDTGTAAALKAHRVRRAEDRLALGMGRPSDEDLVFSHPDGSPIAPGGFSQQFALRAAKASLPAIRLHDLRHTHASLALSAGVDPEVVQERLGHSTVALTLDLYSHVAPAMETDAAERVAALILGD